MKNISPTEKVMASEDMRYLFSQFNPKVETALDLGCGWGQDSIFMARAGVQVDAVDIKLANPLLAKTRNINFIETSFEDFNISQKYDLVNFRLVSHYIQKDELMGFLNKLSDVITDNGYFIGLFLGPKDEWNQSKEGGPTFLDKDEITKCFQKFKTYRFYEREQLGKTYDKTVKFWHQFGLVAQNVSH